MIGVREYAQRTGISPRAVRLRIASGALPAEKHGGTWVITEDRARRGARRPGRRLSSGSFDQLAALLDGDGADLTPDHRRRALERTAHLDREGLAALSAYAERPDLAVHHYRAAPDDLAELRDDSRLVRTGISHPDAEVYGPMLDAYVSEVDHQNIARFHLLEPATGHESDLTLRVQDPPPVVRRLHVIADLLEDPSPRSRAEAQRLLSLLLAERP